MEDFALDTEVPATTEESKVIRPINHDTVHRICSGQVVLSLAIAVKELVENAIDAGATNIEVRLKEYGSEQIEVIDNGSGVEEVNFAALTLKHHTSKIRDFSDLTCLTTLGFRGEALSSLCALTNLVITTRHKSTEIATRIEYDHNGHVKKKTLCARTIGTTVSLVNLFASLPVRRKEFIKNIKREFTKMCQLLYAYCLISTDVKITCTNQLKNGARTTVVATQGHTLRENVISVFGSKQIESLVEIKQIRPSEEQLTEYSIKLLPDATIPFAFEGLISNCIHGSGRSTADRQFYFINNRPCEPTRISKLVNEIYRQYNGNQCPFVFMNIKTEKSDVDVNVTPDKRQIFLEKEKLLLATIKSSLLEMFKSVPGTLKIENVSILNCSEKTEQCESSPLSQLLRSFNKCSPEKIEKGVKRPNNEKEETKKKIKCTGAMKYILENRIKATVDSTPDLSENSDEELVDYEKNKTNDSTIADSGYKMIFENGDTKKNEIVKKGNYCKNDVTQTTSPEINSCTFVKSNTASIKTKKECTVKSVAFQNISKTDSSSKREVAEVRLIVNTSIDAIRCIIQKCSKNSENRETVVKFRSQISPSDNKNAERELQKEISKDMFARMAVIGQFNLGFIIAKLDSDLFIIDQHATDEIYNFETLSQTTVLETQVLVNPKPLELTAGQESILVDNLEVFRKNGFKFNIDENAEATKKISLTTIPISGNYHFGKEDVEELIFMLQNCNYTLIRPSRIRSMFASRACRKSVMIGSALGKADMRQLIDHMGQIEKPWNCPHGRPTMRHLINLDLIETD